MKRRFVYVPVILFQILFYCCSLQNGDNPPIQPPREEAEKLTAADAEEHDYFGSAVAVEGDIALVGADGENGEGTTRGAAYIFYLDRDAEGNWVQIKKLTASDAEDGDGFGNSVALWGDYALVGASHEDGGGTWRGAAYLFYRHEGGADNWGQVKKLTASDAQSSDQFGCSVAVYGDYIIVGAHNNFEAEAGTGTGAAYIFYRNSGGENNWGELKKLLADDKAEFNYFGCAVDICGEFAVVGARRNNRCGAAYVFAEDQGGEENWGQCAKLVAADVMVDDAFGIAVALSGDFIVVGAEQKPEAGVLSGAAYIFHKNAGGEGNWGEVKKLTASDEENNDHFGCSVALDGKYAVIGADEEYGDGVRRGAAYLFCSEQGGEDNWGEVVKLTAFDSANGDYFANSVGISGKHIIVGAERKKGSHNFQGAAYIFRRE
jgi:hypothetical protein